MFSNISPFQTDLKTVGDFFNFQFFSILSILSLELQKLNSENSHPTYKFKTLAHALNEFHYNWEVICRSREYQ